MSALERLAALGIEIPVVPTPAGSYQPTCRAGSLVFTSGQLPTVNGALLATGLVGAEVSPEDAKSLARQAAINVLAAIHSVLSGAHETAQWAAHGRAQMAPLQTSLETHRRSLALGLDVVNM